MGKQLWRSNISSKDLIAVQRYIREYCTSYYYNAWENNSDYTKEDSFNYCKVFYDREVKGSVYLNQMLRFANNLQYPIVEIEAFINNNECYEIIGRSKNGVWQYYMPFVECAKYYVNVKEK